MEPTGFRTTDGQTSCSSCRFFDPREWCWRFDYRVKPFHLSDGFEPSGPGPAQVFGPQQAEAPVEPPPMDPEGG